LRIRALRLEQVIKIKHMSTREKQLEELLLEEEVLKQNEIVLFNDDVNTFDHVIDTLIYACDHTPEQAEQCSLIVHYKGKCTVKTGPYEDLKPRCSKLLEAGLSAEIV
jgi:ATP-dependent Clp protease adaptor protein ClpS